MTITRFVANLIAWTAFTFLCLSDPAPAQQVNLYCATGGSGLTQWQPASATNPCPVSASATISGFTAATLGTPITADTNGETGTLPAGAVVVATNTGAVAAYCQLGASSSTNGQYISPGGGWFAFTVGASTQITCTTASSTAVINLVGGAGLPTGTGGGGGSGGGGAVTMASGAVASGAYSSGSIAAGAQVDLLTMRGTKAPGTAAANSLLTGGVYTSAGITLTDGQQAALQFSPAGEVKVVGTGLASGATTAGTTGSAVMCATTTSITGGTNGTTNWLNCTPAGALRSDISTLAGTTLATNSGNKDAGTQRGVLATDQVAIALWGHGATGASVPANATYIGFNSGGNLTGPSATNPLPVRLGDGTNNQTIDPCQGNTKSYVAISQTASTQLFAGTSAKKTYICHMMIVAADAENVSLVAGTGTVCATNTVAMIGGTSAANGPNNAANSGFGVGSGVAAVAASTVNADNVCLLQSGSGRVAGVLSYVSQ